jgi:hypothetical protein
MTTSALGIGELTDASDAGSSGRGKVRWSQTSPGSFSQSFALAIRKTGFGVREFMSEMQDPVEKTSRRHLPAVTRIAGSLGSTDCRREQSTAIRTILRTLRWPGNRGRWTDRAVGEGKNSGYSGMLNWSPPESLACGGRLAGESKLGACAGAMLAQNRKRALSARVPPRLGRVIPSPPVRRSGHPQ